ncbi:sulfotransferase family 2 domain-containing protein [Primorskyibacter flagellatus]|uniref:Sulfotransferase family protein n=1 Tax=Primorskyibacter flagellatus TaxID=1387277 RepID=A0A1W2EM52_9RHOB|nr:sulfotransferase family 2 domain-containing protein [Primorskyibacter flagellatus]SMD10763.1 Sulfotransferase family protein [Primorskyibacter flagellatus]
MDFSTFSASGLNTFAHQFQGFNPVFVFHHIPKTAGSSLSRELRLSLFPYKNIYIDYNKAQKPKYDGHLRSTKVLMRQSVKAFIDENEIKRFRSASGHFSKADMDIIKAHTPHAAFFTFLRDPVSRTVSAYRYSCTPTHPPYKQFMAQYPSIEAYLENPKEQNRMCRVIGCNGATEATLETVFKRYFFMGLVEDLTLHFEFITGLLGCPKTISTRDNVTAPSKINDISLTPELISRIEQTNSKDMELYSAVQKMVTDKRAEMVDFVAHRRDFYTNDRG